jgi:prevent-host-death family protein
MRTVNLHEVGRQLSGLLEEAARGEEIVIVKAGRPYVRLLPCFPERAPRTLGGWEGRVRISEDFNGTPDEVIAGFQDGS